MAIILVDSPVAREFLIEMSQEYFGDMVKAVVDIEKEIMAIGGGLHSDEDFYLKEVRTRRICGALICIQTGSCLRWSSSIP